jgi:acrylyl-CoA reductase (NADPH)
LANLLSRTRYGGAIAACGVAQGLDLPASVAPFIMRGVSLLGIDSVMCPRPRRLTAWQRLARDLDLVKLNTMTTTIDLASVPDTAVALLEGKVRGRVVVTIPS